MAILERGAYDGPAGRVALADGIADAIAGTVNVPAGVAFEPGPTRGLSTRFEVINETTLDATRRLYASCTPVALNFASAYHPGGGFLIN